MRYARSVLAVGLILVAAGCGGTQKDEVQRIMDSPIDIQSSFEPGTDFSQYKTWNFIPAPVIPDDPRTGDADVTHEIQQAVDGQMFARGYRRVDSGYDLIANFHLAVEPMDMQTIDQMYGGQFPAYKTHMKGEENKNLKWNQGTLILFLFDSKDGQLVWRAAAQAEVTSQSTPQQREARIDKVVTMMLAELPMQSE